MLYLDRFVRFVVTLLWTSLLIGVIALAVWGQRANPAVVTKPIPNLAATVTTGLAVTGAFMGKAIAAALLPALAVGALAGWRRGSLLDRLISLPALLLAGAPVVAFSFVSIWICLLQGWSLFRESGQWVAALLFFPWLALAVRDGVAGARTGPIGTAIVTPRVPVPSLLGAYLWVYTSTGMQRYGTWLLLVFWALGAVPALAHAARRTFAAAPDLRRRTARTLLAGTVLLALGQTLAAELMQLANRDAMPRELLGRFLYSISMGINRSPHFILTAVIVTVAVPGLLLLGFALRDAAGTEVGG